MTMHVTLVGLMVGALILGCAPRRGAYVLPYRPGERPTTRAAGFADRYGLRDAGQGGPEPRDPLPLRASCWLGKGKPLGFMVAGDGHLFGVAGDVRIPLPPGAYQWQNAGEARCRQDEAGRQVRETLLFPLYVPLYAASLGLIGLVWLLSGGELPRC